MTGQPLTLLIVDDEAPARSRMRDLLDDITTTMPTLVVGEAGNGREAIELAARERPEVVLLDVRMPGMDGIEAAAHLRELEQPPAVIFTTAYDRYAIQAFDLHAIDYLLKPIRAQRLAEALARAVAARPLQAQALQALRRAPRSCLGATERGRLHLIPLDEVLYLRAELKYVTVRTASRAYLIEESLTRLEQEFGERFVRVHRNCLVARRAIRGFERVSGGEGEGGWQVLLAGLDERVAVSRRQQYLLRELSR
jgi:two-component system response regulator AlgR